MSKKISKRIKNDLIYIAVRFLVPMARSIPRKAGLLFFTSIGSLVYLLATKDRKRTKKHLREIFGSEWSDGRIAKTARQVFRELGRNAFDALYFSGCGREALNRTVTHDDLGAFRTAYEKGKGVVVITAHIGCFEMLLHLFARQGFQCFAIGRRIYDSRIEKHIERLRSGPNITYMDRTGSGREIIRFLKEGRVFGVLIDQDTRVEGVFANFLGKPAHTPSAPIRIALRYDIPVFVVTTSRQRDDKHHVYITGPLEMIKSGDPNRDVVLAAERINRLISAAILKDPEQWVWMHRRWNKRPDDERHRDLPNIEKIRG